MATCLDNAEADSGALRNIAWCLANFMKGDQPPNLQLVAPAVPSLVRALLRSTRSDVLNDIVWGLSFFTQQADPQAIQIFV